MSPFHYAKVHNENSIDDAVEREYNHTSSKRWHRTVDKFQFLRWSVAFFLLAAILTCELSILHNRPSALQLGGEMNGIIPNFSTEKKAFYTDKRYTSDHRTMESINATKAQWIDLMPRGGGFIEVRDYTSHTLPPPMHYPHAPGKQVYALAVFHELHCLMHLSSSMDKLVLQIRNKDFSLDESAVRHNDHCFNYLRNALLCCGDTTLEGQAQTPRFEHMPGTDGTGAVHVCRNFDEIRAFAERSRLVEAKEHF
ncbi:hypothetical protein DDE82_006856 [Stemphylium lycopersici]|uniref:Oxidase ustYa n=1 Tax=Stemphylium lycopersici TaxID=183478 RepID=A0A364NDB3_STELY|nr:hypothetical protein TW65_07540 [Stemphylium lycopersici]RAR00965.1 hypothetical protein DDE82_006856 [Stemphylium lycopersici]RAR15260.1 hypothetical protein DDE83_001294 [Stemphylium lycopersici]